MKRWRTAVWTLVSAALLAVAGGALLVRQGWYNIGAIDQHWQPTEKLLEMGRLYSVRHHARAVLAPRLTPAMAERGAYLYARHCVQCHGAPGIAPELATLALQPSPGPLVHMPQRWQPNELYWLISNGVKMTGMPAWQFRLSEQDVWSVVAFIEQLPRLSPQQGKAVLTAALATPQHAGAHTDGAGPAAAGRADAARGRVALTQYACHSCHVIPGVPGPAVDVGPPLKNLAQQGYIAGHLPTSEANLARWIRHPDEVKPGTAMPTLQVSERDARDMAHWLLSEEAR